jgi:hypothetical protein
LGFAWPKSTTPICGPSPLRGLQTPLTCSRFHLGQPFGSASDSTLPGPNRRPAPTWSAPATEAHPGPILGQGLSMADTARTPPLVVLGFHAKPTPRPRPIKPDALLNFAAASARVESPVLEPSRALPPSALTSAKSPPPTSPESSGHL